MRSTKFLFLASSLLCLAAAGFGQSLGDVAREQKQKKQSQPAAKVITNEDLPAHADDGDQPPVNGHNSNPPSRPLGSRSAEQWKAQIEAQKNTVASLQARIDKLNSSIHFAYGNCVYHCAEYNESQLKRQDQVQVLQGQLEEAKKKLDELQESARHEGFGNAVWEP